MAIKQSKSDDWFPLEPDQHARQLTGLTAFLSEVRTKSGRGGGGDGSVGRVLDLGCGDGRTIVPLAMLGYDCTGIDSDPNAIDQCRHNAASTSVSIDLIQTDFTHTDIPVTGPFDLITCLGHTWMLIDDPFVALKTITWLTQLLDPIGGRFVIDNFPEDLWPCVTDGSWCTGISEDGTSQMVWETGDNVFALRFGSAVNPNRPQIGADDTRYRLWTMGQLCLLTSQAGLQPPQIDRASHLIWMHRNHD